MNNKKLVETIYETREQAEKDISEYYDMGGKVYLVARENEEGKWVIWSTGIKEEIFCGIAPEWNKLFEC